MFFFWHITFIVVRYSVEYRHSHPSAHQSTGVSPPISVHARDVGTVVCIKHCLSVLAAMWLHHGGARAE